MGDATSKERVYIIAVWQYPAMQQYPPMQLTSDQLEIDRDQSYTSHPDGLALD